MSAPPPAPAASALPTLDAIEGDKLMAATTAPSSPCLSEESEASSGPDDDDSCGASKNSGTTPCARAPAQDTQVASTWDSEAEGVEEASDEEISLEDGGEGTRLKDADLEIISKNPAVSEQVRWDMLVGYPRSDLAPRVYYQPDSKECKPITLTVMGLGVPQFPQNVANLESVMKAVGRNKGCLYKKSEVVPETNRGKFHMLKEIARRHILRNYSEPIRPKLWAQPKCKEWLQKNPPPEIEHGTIVEMWHQFKEETEQHFYWNSGGSEASMLRNLRLIECLIHPNLREAFKLHNRQKEAQKIDASNSRKGPEDYCQRCADLCNSSIVLRSRAFSMEYGEPFHVELELRPPTEEHFYTGQNVEDFALNLRGSFLLIKSSIEAGRKGGGAHDGKTVRYFATGLNVGRRLTHAEATSYGYLRYREEDLFDEFMRDAPPATVPRINLTKRKGSNPSKDSTTGSAKKSKTVHSSAVDCDINLLQRMETSKATSDLYLEIDGLRRQLRESESLLLTHNGSLNDLFVNYCSWKHKFKAGEINQEEDEEEYEHFKICRLNYQNCKSAIKSIESRIASLREEISHREQDYGDHKEKTEKATGIQVRRASSAPTAAQMTSNSSSPSSPPLPLPAFASNSANADTTIIPSLTDLCHNHIPSPEQLRIVEPCLFSSYGSKTRFHGKIETVRYLESNPMVRSALSSPGNGRVLVVDGGGSKRVAILGDQIAQLAVDNMWSGVIVNGCICDSAIINTLEIGVKALGTHPVKSLKDNPGERGVAVNFGGVEFVPGWWVYSDEDGIIVSETPIHPRDEGEKSA